MCCESNLLADLSDEPRYYLLSNRWKQWVNFNYLSLSRFAHPLETRPFRTTLPQLSASFSWQGNINFNCGSFSIQWEMLIQFSNSKRVALRHYSFATPSAPPICRCGGYLRSICLARRASERCLFAYQLADSSHSCSSYNYTNTRRLRYGYIYRCTDSYSYRYRNNTTVTDTDNRAKTAQVFGFITARWEFCG